MGLGKDDARKEAQALDHAIHSKPADHKTIISIISRYDNDDLVDISEEYVKLPGENRAALTEALKNASYGEGSDYAVLLVDLIVPRPIFEARTVHNAITGAGTDETALIDVFAHISKHDIEKIKQEYSQLFQRDLTTQINQDASKITDFGKAILQVLEGKRESFGNPETEAETLYKKGEGKWGTDDDYFIHFFTHHSFESLLAVDEAYRKKYNHSLETAIKKETSGHYQDLLVALVVPREVYWARRIRDAIKGLGTDDTLLRRAFAFNSKEQLRRVEAVYQSVNGKTLRQDVEQDTSGKYKDLFIAILDSLTYVHHHK